MSQANATQPNAETPPPIVDLDDLALATARAAADAEENGGQPPQTPQGGDNTPQQPQQPTTQPSQQAGNQNAPNRAALEAAFSGQPNAGGAPSGPMIPKERFDDVLDQLRGREQEVAYYRGLVEGRAPPNPQDPGQQAGQAPKDYDALVKAEEDALLAAAEQVDTGEITQREYAQKQLEISRKIDTLKAEKAQAEQQGDEQPGDLRQQFSMADRQALLEHAISLEQSYPEFGYLTKEQVADLSARAKVILEASGETIEPTPESYLALQTATAGLARQLFHKYVTDEKIIAHVRGQVQAINTRNRQPAQPAAPTQPNKAPLSPNAQARQQKLQMAATLPPDTAQLGNQGVHNEITEADIEKMSDEDIQALPAATRERIRNGT